MLTHVMADERLPPRSKKLVDTNLGNTRTGLRAMQSIENAAKLAFATFGHETPSRVSYNKREL